MAFGRFGDDSANAVKKSAFGGAAEASRDGSTNASNSALSSYGSVGANVSRKEAYIGKGSIIVGNLQFSGPTELDGQVDGEIEAQDRLTIGESAVVNAKISGTDVVVRGVVNGDIFSAKRITLKKPARVIGCLTTPLLSIEEGVIFEGKIAMVAAEKKSHEIETRGASDSNLSFSKQGDSMLSGAKTGSAVLS